MSLAGRVSSLATRVGSEIKSVRGDVAASAPKLGQLMRPYDESGLVPSSRATVTTSGTAPSWYTSQLTRWDSPGAFNYNGVPVEQNPGNPAAGGAMQTGGGGIIKSWDVTFTFTGDRLALWFYAYLYGDYKLWIDDKPVTLNPVTVGDGYTFVDVAFGGWTTAKIRFAGPLVFVGAMRSTYSTIKSAPSPLTVGVVSDSYFETLAEYMADSPPVLLSTYTGWRVWNLSQGATGYSNNGGGTGGRTTYDSVDRLSRISSAPLDLLIVNGSGNDGALTAAALKTRAKAYYTSIKALKPKLPIVVVGVEPVSAFRSSQGAAINTALLEAAAESSNVVGFVDAYAGQWLTGTGAINNVQNNGNQDYLIAADGVHLTANGGKMYTKLIRDAIMNFNSKIA